MAKTSKVVLITGAGSGMGLATARLLAAQGHVVIGGDLKAPSETDGFESFALDVRREDRVEAFVARALEKAGRIDCVVNAAGYALGGAVEEASLDEAKALFDVNFFGAVRVIQAVLPIMRRQRSGTVINVSSGAAQVAEPFAGHYSASKFAIEGLTEALRMEVRPLGVHAVLLVPGWTRTNIVGNSRYPSNAILDYATVRNRIESLVRNFVASAPTADDVARTIARIVRTDEPRLRYRVGKDVVSSYWTKWLLPAPVYERLVRSYYQLDRALEAPKLEPAKFIAE